VSITVVGSVGLDTIETPFGKKEKVLGGAAVYFSSAASLFEKVRLVGVVGTDFPSEHIELLKSKGIDIEGLEIREGETFSWWGRYEYDMNVRHSIETKLGLFSEFDPIIPQSYKDSKYLFLANIDPELQLKVLSQVNADFTMMDTMDYWISNKKESLDEVISKVDLVLMNDFETRQYSSSYSLVEGARQILRTGPEAVIIKKGEHGAMLVTEELCFIAPAYPMSEVKDPTGAGDSFAGGFLGYLASTNDLCGDSIKRAIIYGSALASFVVEDFSLDRLKNLSFEELDRRYHEFKNLVHY
jgi:sugar/nucleoside kinase (ribokinase family)